MVIVYSKPKCVQCEMTKEFLKQHNVEFEEMNVEENEEALEQIKASGLKRLLVVIVKKIIALNVHLVDFKLIS